MKRICQVIAGLLLTTGAIAQAPQKMSYQAVVRNSSDALLVSAPVGMRISIQQGTPTGTVAYSETQAPTTNANGLVSLEIGNGIPLSGSFAAIDWANGPYYIRTETDPAGGANYTITGVSQLLSTPYALHAQTAESVTGTLAETDPLFGASPANGISSTHVNNWNTAFGWGDHSAAGYLTSFTETDPKVGINATDHLSKWNGTALVTSSIFDNGTVGIGTATPDASAKVEVSSTTGGVLISRMTTAQRNAIASPADGLQIYNTDIHCLEVWNTNGWMSFCGGSLLFNGQAIIGCVPDSWTQKADLGAIGRIGAVSFSIGMKGYVVTGSVGGNYTKDTWEFDPSNNSWTQKADFGGTGRMVAAGFSIGTKGYVGTGYDPSQTKDFWEFDPVANTWTQKADFGGTARTSAIGFSIGAKGYIGVGNAQSPPANDFWEYDPGTDIWTQKADFAGSQRYYATGFSIGNKGYIGTGFNNNPPAFSDFWEYDPTTDNWTQKADFGGTARIQATGFSIGNKGYIGAGYDYTSTTNDFWEYDPNSNSWTKKADFGGTARSFSTGFSIGSKGYMGTGSDGSDQKDFWEYCQ
ncbi:MAG: hypothetical protein K9J06_04730 [Flavobacteriales bacterium]|nr:hypothetical protein [Flavobacteriales bacterium]